MTTTANWDATGNRANRTNWPASGLDARPGYALWIRGKTRGEMEAANRAAGLACYCASIWQGYCDCCTGLAGEIRTAEQLAAHAEKGAR